jgi:hypothetical protein
MSAETAFLGLCLCGCGALSIGIGMAMRWMHRREMRAELREVYRVEPLAVRQWLRGETNELPELTRD